MIHPKNLATGVVTLALAFIAITIFYNIVWQAWEILIAYLVDRGLPSWIEYALGITIFIIAATIGIIKLKK